MPSFMPFGLFLSFLSAYPLFPDFLYRLDETFDQPQVISDDLGGCRPILQDMQCMAVVGL